MMSDQLPDAYWETLGEPGAFMKTLLDTQTQQLQQLHEQNQQLHEHNQHLLNYLTSSQNNLPEAAAAAATVVAQNIPSPMPVNSTHSTRKIKAAVPDKFNGDRAAMEGFVRAVKLSIAVQPDSFPDERTKILYALSFMTAGTAQTWATNKTEAVIDGSSSIETFEEFIKQVEEAFGDPDLARTACTKLHNLKMTTNMMADDYTAQFEILAGRTGFNDAALEDAYARGLPAIILDKIHAQPSLPSDLKAWKESARQIDRNHRRLVEIKKAQNTPQSSRPFPPCPSVPQPLVVPNHPAVSTAPTPSTAPVPMDVDSNRRWAETRTCYNCNKRGHIAPQCPEPRKERIRTNLSELVTSSVAAALKNHQKEKEEDVKQDSQKEDFSDHQQ